LRCRSDCKSGNYREEIAAIGITNQRETTIVWDRNSELYTMLLSGKIVEQQNIDELKAAGYANLIQKDWTHFRRLFFGTKVKWILDNVEGAREKAEQGKLCFGTVTPG
jgi:glycerol kinase